MNRTDEWLNIETLIAGLSEMARDIKEMEDGSSHMSDERCKQAENAIEANPTKAAQSLPQNTPIQQEAVQASEGGPAAEVNNEVVNDFVNDNRYKRIKSEFDDYMKKYNGDQYAGNSSNKRKDMGQFYTPPELTYQMLSKFRKDDMSDEDFENMLKTNTLMDPTAGSGNLLAGGISYGFNPENVYANEPDDNVRENILVPRLTGLGVPRNHIFPSSKHIAKYGRMSDTPEQKEAKYKEWVDNGWIEDSKSNKRTFMAMYGAGNALNGNYLEDMKNPETWDEIIEEAIESSPEEFADSSSQEIAKEAQQIINNDDKRDDEVNNANVEKALRKAIPGTEPDPLGVNISNEDRLRWNKGEDKAYNTRSVVPGTGIIDRAKPKGILGAGMLYSRDSNIPAPSEERPLDANSLEQAIENNPVESAQQLPKNTPIQQEAVQAIDGGRDKEVRNDVAEDFINNNNSIDWNKVKVYKPGEDPIEWTNKEDYDPRDEENLNYNYEEGVGAPGVLKNKDEDFAGPDELPAEIYNNDYEPKQLPAVINDGLPAEQYYEPAYDTSKYNFEWNWEDISDPAEIDKQVDEDDSIPEEEKEEAKKQRHLMWAKHHVDSVGGSSNAGSTFKGDYSTNGSMGFGGGKGVMSGNGGIGSFMANPKWNKPKQEPVKEAKSEASKAPEPVETESKSSPIGVKSNPTTSNRISNGGFNSGGVSKTGNSLIKVNKVSLPNGEANNQPDSFEGSLGTSSGTTNNLRDSRIALLEQRIKQLDPELQEHFGFSMKYKHVEYKDTLLDECSGGQLQEIEDILEACGV